LASRGLRDLGDGPRPITDADELSALRAQARRVIVKSALATGLVMAGAMIAGRVLG
jgi:hypothetical protein